MANSHQVVQQKVHSFDVTTFTRTRYENAQVAYGFVSGSEYNRGDFFVFGQVPSRKIIKAEFKTKDASPVAVSFGPSTTLPTTQVLTQTTSGLPLGFEFIIWYDSNFSAAPGSLITLQVN
jgi:hypothetical protein